MCRTVVWISALLWALCGPSVLGCEDNDTPDCSCCNETSLPKGSHCFGNFVNTTYRPWCPSRMNIRFLLYTRKNPKIAQSFEPSGRGFPCSHYKPHKPLVFLVHGFRGSGPQSWSLKMKQALLDWGDMNVVILNWRGGARTDEYQQACANTRSTGVTVGQMMTVLWCQHGDFYKRVHCIGYSLGAHVCGFAGKEVFRLTNSHIGRITGLDSAGPEFEDNQDGDRLDSTDARFVDAIHTDAPPGGDGWGIRRAVGHVDFYPNGGHDQPGCRRTCNHGRCRDYFTHSIADWHYDPSLETNWCTMGYHVNQSACRGDYSPQTGSRPPYRPLDLED